jgi:hypothetical protein
LVTVISFGYVICHFGSTRACVGVDEQRAACCRADAAAETSGNTIRRSVAADPVTGDTRGKRPLNLPCW